MKPKPTPPPSRMIKESEDKPTTWKVKMEQNYPYRALTSGLELVEKAGWVRYSNTKNEIDFYICEACHGKIDDESPVIHDVGIAQVYHVGCFIKMVLNTCKRFIADPDNGPF